MIGDSATRATLDGFDGRLVQIQAHWEPQPDVRRTMEIARLGHAAGWNGPCSLRGQSVFAKTQRRLSTD